MVVIRHCRHCWGDCPGDCLVDDKGMCIHNVYPSMVKQKPPRVLSPRWLKMLFRSVR